MNLLFSLYISISIFVSLTSQQSSNINNIVFDLADLTIDYETDNGVIHLEAFKSSLNDLIIDQNSSDKFGQLNWLSIGYPKHVLILNRQKAYSLFSLKQEGFDISVDMLTNSYRNLFINVVKRKYNLEVKPEQIVNLIPAKFECQLVFYDDEGDKILINGKVTQLTSFPLKVSFMSPLRSKERYAFEQRLKREGDNIDLDIVCEIYSQGKAYRQNTFIITGNQINQLGLIDEIFGNGNEAYVTRSQISSISSTLYQQLNIIEDYQMPETEFSDKFKDDFIKQTSFSIDQYVSIEQAFAQISKYDFSDDIKPNIIQQELNRLFVINKSGNKEILTLNQSQYEKINEQSTNNRAGSGSGSFFGIKLGGSANFATTQGKEWEKLGTSFFNQLREMNNYGQNEVEWIRVGEIVQAKSIKVSKLGRSFFSKNLVFSRIKREYYDAPFKRVFTLNTNSKLYQSQVIIENSHRLNKVEEVFGKLESFSDASNSRIDQLEKDVKKNKENLVNIQNIQIDQSKLQETRISKHDSLENRFNQLKSEVNSVLDTVNNQNSQIYLRAKGCRICFREIEGSSQCQQNRHTCTGYTSVGSTSSGWTAPFRDDTDNRGGGCTYQWIVECYY